METPEKVSSASVQESPSQHDVMRAAICKRISAEVSRLEHRIEQVRGHNAPHSELIIATYQRMIERKKAFLARWISWR